MRKNSRGLGNFQFVASVIIISLAFIGMVTDSKIIENVMGILFIITTLGVLGCFTILLALNFFYTQKIYKYLIYYYHDKHSNEQSKYKAYFAGYSADRIAEIEKVYNDKISNAENKLDESLDVCINNYYFLTRKQRQTVSDIVKPRESSRA